MTIINQLAASLNRRDEVPNQELAKQIAAGNNEKAVQELVNNLSNSYPVLKKIPNVEGLKSN